LLSLWQHERRRCGFWRRKGRQTRLGRLLMVLMLLSRDGRTTWFGQRLARFLRGRRSGNVNHSVGVVRVGDDGDHDWFRRFLILLMLILKLRRRGGREESRLALIVPHGS